MTSDATASASLVGYGDPCPSSSSQSIHNAPGIEDEEQRLGMVPIDELLRRRRWWW